MRVPKLRLRLALTSAMVLLTWQFAGATCLAQITAEELLADSVEQVGSQDYPLVRRSIELLNRGDFAGARNALLEACKQDSKLPAADVLLARMLLSMGDVTSSRSALENAVAQNPDVPEAYVMLAGLALRESRWTEAELLLARGAELAAKVTDNEYRQARIQARCLAGLASVAESRGNWAEAEQWATRWTKLDPNSLLAQVRRARTVFHQQRLREAFEILRQVHKDHPQSVRPEIRMAYLYEELAAAGDSKMHDSAVRAVQQAVSEAPDRLTTRLEAARWALEYCEIDLAEENATDALRIDDTSSDGLILAGLVARHRKDHATAERMFVAVSKHSQDIGILVQLVMSLAEQDDAEKRKRALELAQQLAPGNDYSQPAARNGAVIVAWVLYRMNQPDRAAEIVAEAAPMGPLSDEVSYLAARILREAGKRDTALRLVRAALANDRCFPMREDAKSLLAVLEK